MGNKTIYVKDDKLWERARRVAGKEGISAVIQGALVDFVQRKAREAAGFKRIRLEAGFASNAKGDVGTMERIAFDGRELAHESLEVHVSVNSLDQVEPSNSEASEPIETQVTVYQTKGQKLILAVEPYHYGIYGSLKELATDPYLATANLVDRAEFLDKIGAELGKDWAVWIE